MDPKKIILLKNKEGQVSSICSVTALKLYLSINKEKEGCLFLNTKTGKELTKIRMSILTCSFVKAKVQDIRKYAASLSFQ